MSDVESVMEVLCIVEALALDLRDARAEIGRLRGGVRRGALEGYDGRYDA